MIKVHRLNGGEVIVNAHLIETIESTPDTILTLTTGRQFVVIDTVDDIIAKAMAYRAQIAALTESGAYKEMLGLVDKDDPATRAYGKEGQE